MSNELKNKIFFHNKIAKIKSEDLRQYFLTFFSLKNILMKLILFFCLGIIVFVTCFGGRQIAINFFEPHIVVNHGVSFGWFSGASRIVVYLIQSLPCVLAFLLFVFTNNKYLSIGFAIVLFSGLSNLIDRANDLGMINNQSTVDGVIDYIPFFKSIINLPDIFITCGAIYLGLVCLIILIQILRSKDDEANQPHESTKEVVLIRKSHPHKGNCDESVN